MQHYHSTMPKTCVHPANTESPDEIIKSLLILEGDSLGVNYQKYRSVVLDLWRDMNLHTVKLTKRVVLTVDKRTNTVTRPEDFLFHSSLSVIDECNKLRTLSVNQHLTGDFIDISKDRSCHCECGCHSDLCGLIKNYEAITEDTEELMPDDSTQTFTSITRKTVTAEGKLVIRRTFPVRIYEDGEWTGVELKTEEEELCQVEVDKCGCVKNTEENICKVNECSSADSFAVECGDAVFCESGNGLSYNYEEDGRRINLPSDFAYDKVIQRYFYEPNVKDLRIPLVAKRTFMTGIKAFTLPFEEKQSGRRVNEFERRYEGMKDKLFTLLNRFSFKEVNQVLNPHRRMP